jgi:hypothetical protein
MYVLQFYHKTTAQDMDSSHWLLECGTCDTERHFLMQSLSCIVGNNEERGDEDSVALILDN